MGTVVLGTGSYLPEKVLTNAELEAMVDTSDEWIRTRTGIESRHISGKGEYTYVLAARAAEKALEQAGVEAEEIGLIIVATLSSHMMMPSSACFVQDMLGARNAFAYDLNAACTGFVYALDTADKYIRQDTAMKVLVIGAETLSNRVDWQDRNTCILFADGAGAVVLGGSDSERGLVGSRLFTDGSLWRLLHMHGPQPSNPDLSVDGYSGPYMRMEGKEVFKHAVKAMEDAVRTLLAQEGVAIEEISLLIPHQANLRILKKLAERLGLPQSKVFINVNKCGNTSAATVPIALDEANRSGQLKEEDLVLFCAFGGGFTWGATLVKW